MSKFNKSSHYPQKDFNMFLLGFTSADVSNSLVDSESHSFEDEELKRSRRLSIPEEHGQTENWSPALSSRPVHPLVETQRRASTSSQTPSPRVPSSGTSSCQLGTSVMPQHDIWTCRLTDPKKEITHYNLKILAKTMHPTVLSTGSSQLPRQVTARA